MRMLRPTFRYATMTVLLACAIMLSGCAVAGVITDVVAGGKTIHAVYEPPDRPTLVLVDDPGKRLTHPDLANLIAGRVGDGLKEHQVVEQVVPTTMVASLREREADFDTWPIDQVGRHAGAQQVIYVLVQEFVLSESPGVYRPQARAFVKVIDVDTGARLYPPPRAEQGHPVATQQSYRDMSGATATTQTLIARNLAETLGRNIAKLFYDHRAPEPGDKLPG